MPTSTGKRLAMTSSSPSPPLSAPGSVNNLPFFALTTDPTSDPRLQEVISTVLAQLSTLLQPPKLSPSPSEGLPSTQCYDVLDLNAAEAAHKAEGERLHLARLSRDSATKAANDMALVEQLAAHRARQDQLR